MVEEMAGQATEELQVVGPGNTMTTIELVRVPIGGNLIVTPDQYQWLQTANLLPVAGRPVPLRAVGQNWTVIVGAGDTTRYPKSWVDDMNRRCGMAQWLSYLHKGNMQLAMTTALEMLTNEFINVYGQGNMNVYGQGHTTCFNSAIE